MYNYTVDCVHAPNSCIHESLVKLIHTKLLAKYNFTVLLLFEQSRYGENIVHDL